MQNPTTVYYANLQPNEITMFYNTNYTQIPYSIINQYKIQYNSNEIT